MKHCMCGVSFVRGEFAHESYFSICTSNNSTQLTHLVRIYTGVVVQTTKLCMCEFGFQFSTCTGQTGTLHGAFPVNIESSDSGLQWSMNVWVI